MGTTLEELRSAFLEVRPAFAEIQTAFNDVRSTTTLLRTQTETLNQQNTARREQIGKLNAELAGCRQGMSELAQFNVTTATAMEALRAEFLAIREELKKGPHGPGTSHSLVDTKIVKNIQTFSGKKRDWRSWSHKFANFLALVEPKVARAALDYAREQEEEISQEDVIDQGWLEFSSALYSTLVQYMSPGTAENLVKNTKPAGHGLEAWRRLNDWYDPASDNKRVSALNKLLSVKEDLLENQILENIEGWEDKLSEYEGKFDTELDDALKQSILLRLVSGVAALKMHLELRNFATYAAMKAEVMHYLKADDDEDEPPPPVNQPSRNKRPEGGGGGAGATSMEVDLVNLTKRMDALVAAVKGKKGGGGKGNGKNKDKGKNPNKDKWCTECKQKGHDKDMCWVLHKHLRPAGWKPPEKKGGKAVRALEDAKRDDKGNIVKVHLIETEVVKESSEPSQCEVKKVESKTVKPSNRMRTWGQRGLSPKECASAAILSLQRKYENTQGSGNLQVNPHAVGLVPGVLEVYDRLGPAVELLEAIEEGHQAGFCEAQGNPYSYEPNDLQEKEVAATSATSPMPIHFDTAAACSCAPPSFAKGMEVSRTKSNIIPIAADGKKISRTGETKTVKCHTGKVLLEGCFEECGVKSTILSAGEYVGTTDSGAPPEYEAHLCGEESYLKQRTSGRTTPLKWENGTLRLGASDDSCEPEPMDGNQDNSEGSASHQTIATLSKTELKKLSRSHLLYLVSCAVEPTVGPGATRSSLVRMVTEYKETHCPTSEEEQKSGGPRLRHRG